MRSAFIYRHARNILDLGEDVFASELEGGKSSSRIVVRTMIESLFKLVAAVKCPAFAAEKVIAEVEEEVDRIRKWIAVEQANEFELEMDETIDDLTRFAEQLRRDHSIPTKRSWNVFDTAKVANLDWHYARDYFLYSKYVHSTISGIISQEQQLARGHVLQTLGFVVLAAVGNAVAIIETLAPQAHLDEATALLSALTDAHKDGAFS